MTTQTLTLADFLLARIAEDELIARAAIADDLGSDEGFANQYDRLVGTHGRPLDFVPRFGKDAARLITRFAVPARVLAECEAKRGLINTMNEAVDNSDAVDNIYLVDGVRDLLLEQLAVPYADHEDFREEWR